LQRNFIYLILNNIVNKKNEMRQQSSAKKREEIERTRVEKQSKSAAKERNPQEKTIKRKITFFEE
jgi:hypothetical protein